MALTQDQIDFFWENGYLRYKSVLTPEELAFYQKEYLDEIDRATSDGKIQNLSAAESPDSVRKVFQIHQICERNIHFRKLLYKAEILDVIEDLTGPNIMLFHDQALYKPAHTGGTVFWHQDNAYWKCYPATLISCWLTLDRAYKENGAMQMIPGSHLKPFWHDDSPAGAALKETKVDASNAVTVELEPGECMFHHCQTLHYTAPNTTPDQRRALAIHFMQPGTRSRLRASDENFRPGWHNPILRMKI